MKQFSDVLLIIAIAMALVGIAVFLIGVWISVVIVLKGIILLTSVALVGYAFYETSTKKHQ